MSLGSGGIVGGGILGFATLVNLVFFTLGASILTRGDSSDTYPSSKKNPNVAYNECRKTY